MYSCRDLTMYGIVMDMTSLSHMVNWWYVYYLNSLYVASAWCNQYDNVLEHEHEQEHEQEHEREYERECHQGLLYFASWYQALPA